VLLQIVTCRTAVAAGLPSSSFGSMYPKSASPAAGIGLDRPVYGQHPIGNGCKAVAAAAHADHTPAMYTEPITSTSSRGTFVSPRATRLATCGAPRLVQRPRSFPQAVVAVIATVVQTHTSFFQGRSFLLRHFVNFSGRSTAPVAPVVAVVCGQGE
jgi:hypothetical protein